MKLKNIFHIFKRTKRPAARQKTMANEAIRQDVIPEANVPEGESPEDKKRMFLKMAGIAGLGAVASFLIPKRADALVFGSAPSSNIVGVKNISNAPINPATQETVASMQANTADIQTQVDKLKFNGNNLEVISTLDPSSVVGVKNVSGTQINPATDDTSLQIAATASTLAKDDSITLLRRLVRLTESLATVDVGDRQRINLDIIAAGVTLPAVTTVTTVSTVSTITSIPTIAGQNQQMYQDVARNTFANGIRNNLSFS